MTIAQSKEKMLHYIREAFLNNQAVSGDFNKDYTASHNQFANAEQRYLATVYERISHSLAYTRDRVTAVGGFDVKTLGQQIQRLCAEGVFAYTFELDRTAPVSVWGQLQEGTWVLVEDDFTVEGVGYQRFFGLIGGNYLAVKLEFGTGSRYHVRNAALILDHLDSVPPFSPQVNLPLPSDFFLLKGLKKDGKSFLNYYVDQGIKVPYDAFGTFEVDYFRYPKECTLDTDVYEVSPLFAELIPLKCAVLVAVEEKLSVASFLEEQYQRRLFQVIQVERGAVKRLKNRLW